MKQGQWKDLVSFGMEEFHTEFSLCKENILSFPLLLNENGILSTSKHSEMASAPREMNPTIEELQSSVEKSSDAVCGV